MRFCIQPIAFLYPLIPSHPLSSSFLGFTLLSWENDFEKAFHGVRILKRVSPSGSVAREYPQP